VPGSIGPVAGNRRIDRAGGGGAAACTHLGFPETFDHNHPESTGVGTGPFNVTADGVRISMAIGYLEPARRRKNLKVLQAPTWIA
jgi:choline dehydrogenase